MSKNLRNRIDVRQQKKKKKKKNKINYTSKPRYMWEKIFDNDLAAICKSKVILTLNKPAYVGICILDLSKVLY